MGNRPTPASLLAKRAREVQKLLEVDHMIGHAYIAAGQIDVHAEHAGEIATSDDRAEDFYAVCKMAQEIARTIERDDIEAARLQLDVLAVHLKAMDAIPTVQFGNRPE